MVDVRIVEGVDILTSTVRVVYIYVCMLDRYVL